MNIFEFLQEMAAEIPYEHRTIKGQLERVAMASQLLEEERQEWLYWLERE